MEKMNIVFLDLGTVGHDLPLPDFASLGEVTVHESTAPHEVADRIKNADIVLTNKVTLTAELVQNAPRLKYIGTVATGYNQVDLAAASARKIPVCNVPNYSTQSVVQHTFGLIFSLAGAFSRHLKAVADGEWVSSRHFCFWKAPVLEMAGKTIGVVGFGDTGQGVARLAHCLGMKVLAYAPRPKPLPDYQPFAFTGLDEIFTQSDVVTLHCPLTPENTGMVNLARLRGMKRSAFFINCARGPLVNEADLAQALHEGLIAGAGLDVVCKEPMEAGNPLLKAPNCLITPHIAWASVEARTRLMQGVFDNIKNWTLGKPSNVRNSF